MSDVQPPDAAQTRAVEGLLSGDGDVQALMRACDWRATPLGPPDSWPSSLRTVVRVMLTSRFAMWMAWGPELTFLCNDAYLPTVGIKRDWVIGSRSDEVWAEIWPDIGPRIDRVLSSGEATWDEALLLYLERRGFVEETYHTFSYSPLPDDTGATAGMLCVVAEVTERVIGERQLATLRDIGARLAAASTRSEVIAALESCLAAEPRDLPFALAYLAEPGGGGMVLTSAHGLPVGRAQMAQTVALDDPDAPWPFSSAPGSTPEIVDLAPDFMAGLALAHWQQTPKQAAILPIGGADGGTPAGFLVAGLNPHRAYDSGYLGFTALVAAQVAAAIARADEYERERERARALAELDRAKTTFFSNVSHEFRTPLTLMLGPLEDALADPAPLPAEQRERLDVAHRNALRLLRLVNSLLDFSRIEAGRVQASYRPTDLAALTADLASAFRSATQRAGLHLVVDTPPLSRPVYADRDMWEKIVLNLLSNAFKFTFEGEITVGLHEAGDRARLVVRDTGTGIPQAELPRLFDRFHRVEGAQGRSFEGSGIGLALVQELVKLHGGTIAVESEFGRGTAFTIELPFGTAHLPSDRVEQPVDARGAAIRAQSVAAVGAQSFVEEALRWLPGSGGELLDGAALPDLPPGEARAAEGHRTSVVLADDNADLRGYIARLLSERGHDVRPVGDGLAALEALRAERPDILVTDVMMPGLDGFGLLRAVRDDPALRDLPVLMLSARAGEEAKVEGLDAGADDYLTKPFSARELLARVAANVAMARVRREAAEAVRASETRAARVLAGMTEGYVLFDRDLRVVEVNDAAVRIDGRPRERLLGRLHGEVWPGSELAPLFAKVMERQEPGTVEEHYVWPDGHAAWLEVNIYPVADGLAVFFRDVSDRRRAQERLRELNATLEARVDERTRELLAAEEALRQAQKMEAVGQLTGGIAHDFNNLLTIVTGNVDMARRALGNAELGRAARALENALKGAERAASLTQRLLAFSRRQPLAPKPISVDRLVSGMAELLHRALGETVSLETVTTPGLWRVEADPNQLESALLNLAVNARDAMPRGGKLLLETANVHLDQQYAAVHAEVAPGNYVVIAMTDTGCGMSRETLARVFDPFFTTKEVGKGTGLGLSMVYGFVKQSGGHIKIYSEPVEGTTVKIYLPRLMSGEVVEEERSAPPVDRAKRGLTILVVEDDDDLRGYTVEILRELGYRVLEAHDGPAALRLLERPELVVDLLFTDVVMPAMSGRELADKTREMRPGLKVLYTSGYTRNAIVHGGRLDLGVEMIAKPFSYNGLAEKISDMLDGGQSGRVLVVEADPAVRMFAVEALREAGFTADEAADAAEALGRIRAAQGGYDAVVIDAGLPGKPGDALAADIRAERADLKLLICGGGDLSRLRGERGVAVIGKPYDAAALYAALASLGVQRRVAIPPG